jgi:hypothetical protein
MLDGECPSDFKDPITKTWSQALSSYNIILFLYQSIAGLSVFNE